ncbi:TPA: UDP-N-acetylglucosamine 1-carboxyvinyltransferase [Candidatus Ventrenecus stercoripullorum]|nr:UDP-N-acetylglucosamine 1-carboxyvinyltransferase [Candidatus Ventrenecus stercoripullorum]
MKKIVIEGGKTLTGSIRISGAKNSAVALIPASILCDEETTIYSVPEISDRDDLIKIIELLKGKVMVEKDTLYIDSKNVESSFIPENLSTKLRASYYFMGALLGKKKRVEISLPGGCKIGDRKIDIHLKAFQALGATIKECRDKYIIEADKLIGTKIYFDFASVGATINTMLAAVKAEGTTIINNAAKEPEIVNVATFLNNMGAKITGAGTSRITIEGVEYLHKAMIEVIPDRIEAGTYIIIGALLGKELYIENIIKEHLMSLLNKLQEIGIDITEKEDGVIINHPKKMRGVNITTLIYPGFPTDLAQPISVLLTQCEGTSVLEETIYTNRMGQVPYLNSMGADITVQNQIAYIKGPTPLYGNDVTASDLRAGASLVIAGLIAQETTTISEVEHILRGYEHIVEKLSSVGASIKIIEN